MTLNEYNCIKTSTFIYRSRKKSVKNYLLKTKHLFLKMKRIFY